MLLTPFIDVLHDHPWKIQTDLFRKSAFHDAHKPKGMVIIMIPSLFVCLFTWGLFTCRVRWSIWAEQSLGRLLGACWTQREESSPIRIKKSLADDGRIINGFSVGMELICSDYCPLKGSLFLEAIDASTSHNSLRESTGPAFPYCWFTPR